MNKLYILIAIIASAGLTACGEFVGQERTINEFVFNPCQLTPASVADIHGAPDPLEDYQWYLKQEFANVTGAWGLNNDAGSDGGEGIQIGVVDDALQFDHEDLNSLGDVSSKSNINPHAPTNHPARNNPYPTGCDGKDDPGHGTAVAGIIAARGDNGKGIKGVAYNAKVWGANLIQSSTLGTSQLEAAFSHRVSETAIMSNSWGDLVPTQLANAEDDFKGLINTGLTTGFNNKGISYVFAAGNEAEVHKDTNGDNIRNSQDRSSYSERLNHHGIIVVCAVGADHQVSSYSEQGPNLWLCGYSSAGRDSTTDTLNRATAENSNTKVLYYYGLPSLDLSGDSGFNLGRNTIIRPRSSNNNECVFPQIFFNFGSPNLVGEGTCGSPPGETTPINWNTPAAASEGNNTILQSYTRYFTGTSAATPLVSGVIALMRSAKPELTWRDVKLILAESAKEPSGVTFAEGEGFIKGANTYSTDDGDVKYSYSEAYGFGIVDAAAAVGLAQKWDPLPAQQTPFESTTTRSSTIEVTSTDTDIDFIEYVQVEIKGGQKIDNFGNLDLKLTSPSGVERESVFAIPHTCVKKVANTKPTRYSRTNDCPAFASASAFTFGSAKHLGENPTGTWTLTATENGNNRQLNWKLIIHGHRPTNR